MRISDWSADVCSSDLEGEDITGLRANKLVGRGVGFIPQTNNVFPSLTIEENLQMGLYQNPKAYKERLEFVTEIFAELGKRLKQRAGSDRKSTRLNSSH